MDQARGGSKLLIGIGLFLIVFFSFSTGYLLGMISASPDKNLIPPPVLFTPGIPTSTLLIQTPEPAPTLTVTSTLTIPSALPSETISSSPTPDCKAGCLSSRPGCLIKGNISVASQQKIYHLPEDKYYAETFINPDEGERWFCSEEDARQNGWRRTKE